MKKCPECGKEFEGKKEKSALRLHMIKSHGYYLKNGQKVQCDQPKKKVKAEPTDECQHEWKILNSDIPEQKRAKDYGYLKYCIKCEELM